MNETKKRYKKKIKTKKIDFYLDEADLYAYAQRINFQKNVKWFLKASMKLEQMRE